MLFSQYNDDRLMFVHRSDKHPSANEFPEMYLSFCEIILPLSGNICFNVEGTDYIPKFGDVMIFSPHELHKTVVIADTPYERIVIQIRSDVFSDNAAHNEIFSFFKNLEFGKINILKKQELKATEIESYIKGLADIRSDSPNEILPLLFPMLKELQAAIERKAATGEPEKLDLSTEIINYINDNLSGELVPDEIADRFHISRSKLDKLFRKSFDTSVWNYIVRKRIKYARSLIHSGEKPTAVALKCGFKDYTAFFKAYKARFGVSPKEDKK